MKPSRFSMPAVFARSWDPDSVTVLGAVAGSCRGEDDAQAMAPKKIAAPEIVFLLRIERGLWESENPTTSLGAQGWFGFILKATKAR